MNCETNDFLELSSESLLIKRNINIYSFGCVDSTNSLARRMTVSGEAVAPSLFIADRQTDGRGRMGRSFFSPSGTGIYLSLVTDVTEYGLPEITRMTSASAVAVSRAIGKVTGGDVGIKWVNDLYFRERKVCGILAESFSVGDRRYAVVGVGINLSTSDFPPELRNIAGSLTSGADTALRRSLALETCIGLCDIFAALADGDASYMSEYRARSIVIGKPVNIISGECTESGTVLSVEDDGSLKIRLDNGEERLLSSGEISLRLR